MLIYNKLVRDYVPDHIRSTGDTPKVITLSDEHAFREALVKKLMEEVAELIAVRTKGTRAAIAGEYADVYEVLEHLARCDDLSHKDIILAQKAKRREKGSFFERLFLVSVQSGK